MKRKVLTKWETNDTLGFFIVEADYELCNTPEGRDLFESKIMERLNSKLGKAYKVTCVQPVCVIEPLKNGAVCETLLNEFLTINKIEALKV